MKICYNCKVQNHENATFCAECGFNIQTQNVSNLNSNYQNQSIKNPIHCRNCGRTLQADAYACTGCGLPPFKGKNHCHNCGSNTHQDAIICVTCGVKLSNYSPSNFTGISTNGFDASVIYNISFWGAILCILGFILPWIDLGIFSGNGILISTTMLGIFAPYRIVFLAIPLISIAYLFNLFIGKKPQIFSFINFAPLFIIIVTVLAINFKIDDLIEEFDLNEDLTITKAFGYGIYITILGTILLCFTDFKINSK